MVSTGSPVRIRPSALPLRSSFGDLREPIPGTKSSPARSCSLCPRLSVLSDDWTRDEPNKGAENDAMSSDSASPSLGDGKEGVSGSSPDVGSSGRLRSGGADSEASRAHSGAGSWRSKVGLSGSGSVRTPTPAGGAPRWRPRDDGREPRRGRWHTRPCAQAVGSRRAG